MLEQVLQAINNYYVFDHCDLEEIETNGVVVQKPADFIVGQYVLILGSKINDGVYQILSKSGSKLVLDVSVELVPETTEDMVICGLSIPMVIHKLVAEIEAYNDKNDGSVKSESLGDYSVSYNGNQDATWITVFRNKLAPYKKAYLTLPYKRTWLYDKFY